jgi:cleavage and polyadenylation specificity factor subunit 3
MFLETQFGADALTPIETPRLSVNGGAAKSSPKAKALKAADGNSESEDMSESEADDEESQSNELERLHRLGIPVPGIEIKVDNMVARVWLEDLTVESSSRVFEDRVRVVVERAVETVASLWAANVKA